MNGFSTNWKEPIVFAGGSSPSPSPSSSSSSSSSTPFSLLGYLQGLNPWAIYDASTVVTTGSSISQIVDITGNGHHLTDSQVDGARMQDVGGEILGSTGRCFIGALPSGVMPLDFHAFIIVRMKTIAINSSGNILSAFSGPNSNYGYQYSTDVNGNFSSVGGFGAAIRLSFSPVIALGSYMLCECIYDSGNLQSMTINGIGSFPSFGSFSHANFDWSGLRLNTSAISTSNRHPLAYKNITIFDITGGALTRAQLQDIYEAYAMEYPDIQVMPRYIP